SWAEYKKYFETDAALKRRFQVVKIAEPEVDLAVRMIRGFAGTLERHHQVGVLDEAVEDAVKLSHRYLTERQLPDKAVSLLDTACARVALSRSATPAALGDCQREIGHPDLELGILQREAATGARHGEPGTRRRGAAGGAAQEERRQEGGEGKQAAEEGKAALEKRWEEEKKLVGQITELRTRLAGGDKDGKAADGEAGKQELAKA